MPAGYTLVELAVVLAMMGIVLAIGVPGAVAVRDRAFVGGAANDIMTAFSSARSWALRRGRRTAVTVDTTAIRVVVRAGVDTLLDRPLGAIHGVQLSATRDSMAYASDGMGYGASNLRIIVRRGRVADTIVVSRLGRVRRQ